MIVRQLWQIINCLVKVDPHLIDHLSILVDNVILNLDKSQVEVRLGLVGV